MTESESAAGAKRAFRVLDAFRGFVVLEELDLQWKADTDSPKPPRVAYRDAIHSPVYRLSELMFGSLLAAYVLGFITFAAAAAGGIAQFSWDRVLNALPFLFVSVSYAYITAGMYVSYHAGILTMNHMPLGRLSFDFMVALAQAVAFGVAMLDPVLFPASIGATLAIAIWRQQVEHRRHVDSFYSKPTAEYRVDPEEPRRRFRKKFDQLLKDKVRFKLLLGWESAPGPRSGQAFVLLGVSVLTFISVRATPPDAWWQLPRAPTLCAISGGVFAIVWYKVHQILTDNAALLLNLDKMDEQFDDFSTALGLPELAARQAPGDPA